MHTADALLREAEANETKTKLIAVLKVALSISLLAATVFFFGAPWILGEAAAPLFLATFPPFFANMLLTTSYYKSTGEEIESIENLIPDNPILQRDNNHWYNMRPTSYPERRAHYMMAGLLGPAAILYHAFTKVARCRRVLAELRAEIPTTSDNFANHRSTLPRDIANARGTLDREAATLSSSRASLNAGFAQAAQIFRNLAPAADQTAYRLNAVQVEVNARRASWNAVAAFYATHLPEFR